MEMMTLKARFVQVLTNLINEADSKGLETRYFIGDFDKFEEECKSEHYDLIEMIGGREHHGEFVWSDTPTLGVGNSCDTDPDNIVKWVDQVRGDPMEIAYINIEGRFIVYLQIVG